MKTALLFLLLPIGAIILLMLGVGPNDQLATFLMAMVIIAVGAGIVRFVR